MHDFALLAVRPPAEAKTRLADALTPAQREALAWNMARHVLGCMTAVLPPERCIVVSRSSDMREYATAAGAVALREVGADQNAALTQGAHHAVEHSADRVLTLSSDLPMLQVDDVRAMLASSHASNSVIIAPDRHGTGTNGMCMQPPLILPYLHGRDSLDRHRRKAAELGVPVEIIERPGLAHDIDVCDDLYPTLTARL